MTNVLAEMQTAPNGVQGFVDITGGGIVGDYGWRRIAESEREMTMPKGLAERVYGLIHERGDMFAAQQTLRDWHETTHVLGGAPTALREDVTVDELGTITDGSIRTHIMDAWSMVEWPWEPIVDVVSYPDYETHKIVTLGDGTIVFSGSYGTVTDTRSDGLLPEVPEAVGYNEMRLSEKYETIAIKDYGAVISITDRTLRADSKNVLMNLPRTLGVTARNTVSQKIANMLEASSHAGPTMTEDSAAAFSSTRGNLGSSGLSLSYVNTGVAAMAGMKSYNGASAGRVLGLVPRWLVVPAAYKLTADSIVSPTTSRLIDGTSTGAQNDYNPLNAMLTVSMWPTLESTSWYLLTDKAVFPHIQVAFLDGRREPIIEVQGGMGADLSSAIGRKYRVRIPHGVGLVDWRGVYASSA